MSHTHELLVVMMIVCMQERFKIHFSSRKELLGFSEHFFLRMCLFCAEVRIKWQTWRDVLLESEAFPNKKIINLILKSMLNAIGAVCQHTITFQTIFQYIVDEVQHDR